MADIRKHRISATPGAYNVATSNQRARLVGRKDISLLTYPYTPNLVLTVNDNGTVTSHTAPKLGTTYTVQSPTVSDTFPVNGAVSTTETGQVYLSPGSNLAQWTVSSNRLRHSGTLFITGPGQLHSTLRVATPFSDVQVQITMAVFDSSIAGAQGIAFRIDPITGFYFWFGPHSTSGFTLRRFDSGGTTIIANYNSLAPATGQTLRVETRGTDIKCYVNATLAISATDSFNLTSVDHGIFTNTSTTQRWDNFSIAEIARQYTTFSELKTSFEDESVWSPPLTSKATVTLSNSNRLVVDLSTSSVFDTQYVRATSGTSLSDFGLLTNEISYDIQANSSTGNSDLPASVVSGVESFAQTDPLYFRVDNRALINLAGNDHAVNRDIVALRDGYDVETGALAAAELRDFKENVSFKKDITVTGNINLTGSLNITGIINEVSVTNLTVEDRTITLNVNESGAGASGDSGVIVERGTVTPNAEMLFKEAQTAWVSNVQIKAPAFLENSQITIGDGTTTFGHVNGTDFTSALNSALALVGVNGGRIFVKRGNYSTTAGSPTISTSYTGVLIEGEGASTQITIPAGQTFSISGTKHTIKNLLLKSSGSATLLTLNSNIANCSKCIITQTFFEGSSATDISFPITGNHAIFGCISTTGTTALP